MTITQNRRGCSMCCTHTHTFYTNHCQISPLYQLSKISTLKNIITVWVCACVRVCACMRDRWYFKHLTSSVYYRRSASQLKWVLKCSTKFLNIVHSLKIQQIASSKKQLLLLPMTTTTPQWLSGQASQLASRFSGM